ncbi:MAG: RDD family protein [Planctomycetes bacterium]|nr:RDD family protein [Planctomycetota bacterium]
MSTGTIEFACPYCEKVTTVPAVYGGRQGKCPGCQKVIEVPLPPDAGGQTSKLGAAPTAYEPPPAPPGGFGAAPQAIGTPVRSDDATPTAPAFDYRHGGGGGAPTDGPERPCPACGESIKAAARKCKFCGEFLDESLRTQRRGGAAAANVGRLASPWTRLAAALLDGMLGGVPTMGLVFGGFIMLDQRAGGAQALGGLLIGVGLLYLLAYSVYNWYLISTRGQNITKGWFGIKIVRIDGTPVDFVSGVILRNWVYQLIGMIPYVGGCVQFVGVLMIFGEDRRCLHDHIASTVVVEV